MLCRANSGGASGRSDVSFFFFQAEDGIRDGTVTGVQTCALPISTKAAGEAKLALEPVSIYISRSTQKLYVRRATRKPVPDGGEYFDATIEVPVKIRNPERRIGTHVFTAMASSDAGLRWSAVTIDEGDDAKNALDRVTIPQEALDRVAPTALPRSPIIVSDEPLSAETNYRTEFVAVLSNHPQGGFITRQRSDDIFVAGDPFWDDGRRGYFREADPFAGNRRARGGPYDRQMQQPFWR